MQDAKEEVRSRLAIEDVVGEYVQLKRAGRNFRGLSPFSAEKTPSFYVSPDKNIWHDFSSNKGGDVFSFVMEVEGMDFRQALELLARKAGVDLSMYDTQGSQEISRLKKRLIEANKLAANYYQHSLIKNQHALDYVTKKRKLNKQVVQDFLIGYAPTSGNALVKFLTEKGFSKKELTSAGLLNRFGSDMFNGRMMVPLMDTVGQVIGFTGRILVDDPKAPKYLNTAQTLLYDKGRHVFGLSQAKEAIRQSDYAVVVEGNLDVVSSHQVGIKQVIASAGTAMTEHHLKALSRLTLNVRLAFDGDKAGLAATERALPIAQMVGVDIKIISLPEGSKDPDELIQKDSSLWQKAIDDAEPAVDWVLKNHSKIEDLASAAGKRRFTSSALRIVDTLKDEVEKEHYLKMISEMVDTSIDTLKAKLKDSAGSSSVSLKRVTANQSTEKDNFVYQDNLFAVALIDTATHDLFRDLDVSMFTGDNRQDVARYIASNPGKTIKDTPDGLQEYDTYVRILLLKADARYADWNDQDRYFESARLLRQIIKEHKNKQKIELTEQLRDAEAQGDDTKATQLRSKINDIIKEI